MPRNFVLLFHEKQGTSPIIRLLDRFRRIDVVHTADGIGWEPLDAHNCGPMRTRDYVECLDIILGSNCPNLHRLNSLYTKTARAPLAPFARDNAVGFKMRLKPHRDSWIPHRRRRLQRLHRESTLAALARHRVLVFIAQRRDIFRWALSFYHGDGTGRPGHLQFQLAAGVLQREEVPPIRVDCDELAVQIRRCEQLTESDRRLRAELDARGIDTATIQYEELCRRPYELLTKALDSLEVKASAPEINAVLAQGAHFEKVHPDDFSEFVLNHREVAERFGVRPAG
jgi:LPS sulfotransferase NodH